MLACFRLSLHFRQEIAFRRRSVPNKNRLQGIWGSAARIAAAMKGRARLFHQKEMRAFFPARAEE
jgi:hypothetical protein